MLDLHLHSTCSDGRLTPEELVSAAVRLGLAGIALTDHDTVAGNGRFLAAASGQGIVALPGVEMSAAFKPGGLHLLGYGVNSAHPGLLAALQRILSARAERNAAMLEKLNAIGLPIGADEYLHEAGAAVAGRPHMARIMIRKGYVRSRDEAFKKYLVRGKAAYVERWRLEPEAAIAVLRAAGGVPVLAHPCTLGLRHKRIRQVLERLAAAGLAGVEVFYPEHAPDFQQWLLAQADGLGLLATGGSDYHGEDNGPIRMGVGSGSLLVPDERLSPLQALIL